jgi:hypothetical protein
MIPRTLIAVTACLMAAPAPTMAQFGPPPKNDVDITFRVPLNLTNLAADISGVAVSCLIGTESGLGARLQQTLELTPGQDVEYVVVKLGVAEAVFKGQGQIAVGPSHDVITTLTVVVTLQALPGWAPTDHFGETMAYYCGLLGASETLQRWEQFSETHALEAFRLTSDVPASAPFPPDLLVLAGTFVL